MLVMRCAFSAEFYEWRACRWRRQLAEALGRWPMLMLTWPDRSSRNNVSSESSRLTVAAGMEAAWPKLPADQEGSLAAEARAAGVAGMPTGATSCCFSGVEAPVGGSGWCGTCGGSWGCAECVRACCAAGGCSCAARMQRAGCTVQRRTAGEEPGAAGPTDAWHTPAQ